MPTTVSPVISHDPRHGRWILPLIIAAMVVLTYTFVNGIEPAETPSGEPEVEEPPFPTTPTTSTTTLPPNVAAFMVTLDIFENQLNSFSAEVDRINSRWETREDTFGNTRQARCASNWSSGRTTWRRSMACRPTSQKDM